jgi:hypothetical protein
MQRLGFAPFGKKKVRDRCCDGELFQGTSKYTGCLLVDGTSKAFVSYLTTRHERAAGLVFHVTCETTLQRFCSQRAFHIAAVLRRTVV